MSDNKLKRRLNFNDMFFTGVSYMIGAGIFTLMPFIIKYGGKNTSSTDEECYWLLKEFGFPLRERPVKNPTEKEIA